MDRDLPDNVDKAILQRLNGDGRIPYEAVGDDLDIPADEIERRVTELEEAGIITRFTVMTDPMALGYIPVAFGLTTEPGKTDETAQELQTHESIYKLWILSGRHSMVAHACFEDIQDFQEFTHETINNIDGITGYESSIATRSVVDEGNIIL